jgi:hypothetical protein
MGLTPWLGVALGTAMSAELVPKLPPGVALGIGVMPRLGVALGTGLIPRVVGVPPGVALGIGLIPWLNIDVVRGAEFEPAVARPNALPMVPGLFCELKKPLCSSLPILPKKPGLLSELKPGPDM